MNELSLKNNKVIAVVGPTASGKTSFAIELAKQIDGEIVSADSRLVYKGFDIGTAKPTRQEQSQVPHYMIDIVEPEFDYSAGLYKKQATEVIENILNHGKIPIVVGGTGLYIDILLKNYSLPEIEPDYKLRNELKNLEFGELYEIATKLDANCQDLIEKNDKKRAIRLIEILKKTGLTIEQARGYGQSGYAVEWIGKNYERTDLYERINKRVDNMIEMGLIEETKQLLKKHGTIPTLTCTIGYREIIKYLSGECNLEEAIKILKQNTRNYAKRQLTWFRKNPDIKWDIYPEKLKK